MVELLNAGRDQDVLDVYIVSGGYAFSDTALALQDRLYVNNGTGDCDLTDLFRYRSLFSEVPYHR